MTESRDTSQSPTDLDESLSSVVVLVQFVPKGLTHGDDRRPGLEPA